MTQKIIIHGFPHCGTSILKSIIGHTDDVKEIFHETKTIDIVTDKKFALCKFPYTQTHFFGEEYKDYIKIFIIRNPLFVMSSLNKRFTNGAPSLCSIRAYIDTIRLFIKYRNNNQRNVYTIRYEDLFINNFEALKQLLDNIGIKYTNNIFNNTEYVNTIIPGVECKEKKPKNTDHGEYRTWQINQPFVSNNNISELSLSKTQVQQILNNNDIATVYPDIYQTS